MGKGAVRGPLASLHYQGGSRGWKATDQEIEGAVHRRRREETQLSQLPRSFANSRPGGTEAPQKIAESLRLQPSIQRFRDERNFYSN